MPQPTRSMIHVDRMMTQISVAYQQSPNAFIADRAFPRVPVQKQSDRYFRYLREDWWRDEAEKRAPAAESAGGDYRIDNTPTYFCEVYAYHRDITEQDRVNADAPLTPDADATEFVTQKLLLKREKLWVDSYFKSDVWATDKQGGDTIGGGVDFIQFDLNNSDPIGLIKKARIYFAERTGMLPNKVVMNPYVWACLEQHEDFLDRIKHGADSNAPAIVRLRLLAQLWEVDEILIPWAVESPNAEHEDDLTTYQTTDISAQFANFQFLYGKHLLLLYSAPRPGLKTPSAGYIFPWKGLLGANAYGTRIVRIPVPLKGMGTERIEGEMAFDMKVVARDMGIFFKDCISDAFTL